MGSQTESTRPNKIRTTTKKIRIGTRRRKRKKMTILSSDRDRLEIFFKLQELKIKNFDLVVKEIENVIIKNFSRNIDNKLLKEFLSYFIISIIIKNGDDYFTKNEINLVRDLAQNLIEMINMIETIAEKQGKLKG